MTQFRDQQLAGSDDSGANQALERLISRFLDHECTSDERRRLKVQTDYDLKARALLDDYIGLDREIGHSMRSALGRTLGLHRSTPFWIRATRTLALAAAACFAAWFVSWPSLHHRAANDAQLGSTLPQLSDIFDNSPAKAGRPAPDNRDLQRDWILIPSDKPNEYMVIEVNRVRPRGAGVHQDS